MVLAELLTMATVGVAMHAIALRSVAAPSPAIVALICAQSLNFFWLIRLVVAVELSWQGLNFVCRNEQLANALMLALDVAMQVGSGFTSGDFAARQFAALA